MDPTDTDVIELEHLWRCFSQPQGVSSYFIGRFMAFLASHLKIFARKRALRYRSTFIDVKTESHRETRAPRQLEIAAVSRTARSARRVAR